MPERMGDITQSLCKYFLVSVRQRGKESFSKTELPILSLQIYARTHARMLTFASSNKYRATCVHHCGRAS